MIEFLVGSVERSNRNDKLRVLANPVDDPTRRWTADVDELGSFSLSADNRHDLFNGSNDSVGLIVRLVFGTEVIARQRVTVESADLAPRELRLKAPSRAGFWVGGTVLTQDGRSAPDLSVLVFLVSTAGERQVARARTDQDGRWETTVPNKRKPHDLRVTVLDAHRETIVSGPLRCDVRGELEESLSVPDTAIIRPSRYDQFRRQLRVALEGREIETVDDQGVELVACRIGESPEAIRQMRESARWQASGASAAAAFAMSTIAPITPSSVLNISREELTRTLDDAVMDGIVPAFRDPLERVVATLRQTAASFAVDEPPSRERRAWLRQVGAPSALAEEIVRLEHLGDLDAPSTWERLARAHPQDIVALARDGVEMSNMGLRHAPLVQLLARRRQASGSIALSRMLPRLSLDEIEALLGEEVDGQPVDVPQDFRDAGGNRRAFALGVMRTIERRAPTATALHARSRATNNPTLAELVELNPDLDLARPDFVGGRATDRLILPVGAESAVVLADLRTAQRQFAVSPVGRRVETMGALQRANLDSATAIVATGPAMFARAVSDDLDIDTIRTTYRHAAKKSAMAVALITRHTAALEVYAPTGPLRGSTATLESLFGPMSFCACEHCRSVLSPAAYLADLLQFVRQIPVEGTTANLFNLLVQRKHRSDVPNLLLNCANSHTALPYIDLVNELLEAQLAPIMIATGTRQTSWSEAELRAHPEHLLSSTYLMLRDDMVFPMSLPFDLFFTEVRAYLDKAGVAWSRMLDVLLPASQTAASEVGAATIGMSPAMLRIVVDEQGSSLESLWGVGSLAELRTSVGRFLDRAALSFDELQGLLATRFFQRPVLTQATPPNIVIRFAEPCRISSASFEGMPARLTNLMGRTHRFLRLWRVSGWSMRELDLAIMNIGGGRIDRDLIASLGQMHTLSRQFPTVSLTHMLAWWGTLDTRRGPDDAPSHFDDLFSRPRSAGSSGSIATIDPLVLNSARTELLVSQQALGPLLPRVAAGLQVPVGTLESLIDAMAAAAPTQGNLTALSTLFRHVSFGRALGQTPAQVRRWANVLAVDPFVSPGSTLRFLSLRKSALDLGATLGRLSYALGFDEPATVAPAGTTLAKWLAKALTAMQGAVTPDLGPDPTDVDALHFELSSLFDSELVEHAMQAFGATSTSSPDEDPNAALISLLDPLVESDVIEHAVETMAQGDAAAAAELLASALASAGRLARQRRAAAQSLADSASVAAPVAELLLSTITTDDGSGGEITLLEALRAQPLQDLGPVLEAIANDSLPFEMRPDLPLALQALLPLIGRWHRGAVLLASLGLDAEGGAWLMVNAAALEAIAPNRLADPTDTSGGAMERTLAVASMAARNAGPPFTAVARLFDAALASPGQLLLRRRLAGMASMLNWDLGSAAAVAAQLELTTDEVLDGSAVQRIDEALALLAAGDIAPVQAIEWVNAGPAPTTASAIKALVSARVGPQRRAAELGAVRDPIRAQQRDALVAAYLAVHPELDGPDALYAEFLIDPAMNSCRTASRIQQGIAAVQRLMNRVHNGLEGEVRLSDAMAPKWTWMSSYRVWEANRKVFLWPENWLDPTLRLDRTPLFDEAAAGLSGAEVSDQDGETAVRDYLYGLRAIARLDVAGLHYDEERNRLHVFARGHDTTRAWYHRVREDDVWKPWRVVPLQIEAPELLPLTYRNQLMLVWPKLTETLTAGGVRTTALRLAWSSYESGNWAEIHETGEDVSVKSVKINGYQNLRLVARQDLEKLRILPIVSDEEDIFVQSQGLLEHFVSDTCADDFRVDGFAFPIDFKDPVNTQAWRQSFKRSHLGASADRLRLPLLDKERFNGYTSDLMSLNGPYRIYSSLENIPNVAPAGPDISKPTVLEHAARTFLLWPRLLIVWGAQPDDIFYAFRFELLYHPFASELLQQLSRAGVEGIYRPGEDVLVSGLKRQQLSLPLSSYQPGDLVDKPFPEETFDFSPSGAYGEYNWELFFHIPLMVAAKLRTVGRFADAKRWLERIFDPAGQTGVVSVDPAAFFWLTKPLWQAGKTPSIEDDLELLSAEGISGPDVKRRADLILAIQRWAARPFEPHVIAQLRPGAYQRQTVMAYLDTLIAWGDSLFSRRTAEALDEATQLYLLAADLLGQRPEQLPARDAPEHTFNDLVDQQDAFGNFYVEIENHIPNSGDGDDTVLDAPDFAPAPSPFDPTETTVDDLYFDPFGEPTHPIDGVPGGGQYGTGSPPWVIGIFTGFLINMQTTRMPYFCVPPNEKLLGYWDTVEDRLYKLRNCLDLEGQRLVPDLFAPPIDPGALVAAIAQGVDLASAIDDLFAPMPHYRFHAALAKAKDLNALVRDLGRTVLSAIERADTERFSLVSNQAEEAVLQAVGDVHQQRLQEASDQIEALKKSKEVTEARASHFYQLIDEGLFDVEEEQRSSLDEARGLDEKAANRRLAVGITHAIPSVAFNTAFPGVPAQIVGSYGTQQVAAAFDASAEFNAHRARRANSRAALQGTDAGEARRLEDWQFQEAQANKDVARIDAELTVANVRKEIASRELKVHQRNVATNRQVREFLQAKFTRVELHDWMANAAGTVHRAAFNLAIDLARKAQRAYRYELAEPNATFVSGAYWESNRKGLLAGERLALDLERMEVAYIENNRREHELLKRVSLAQIDPGALLQLRYTGSCEIDVPEVLFELDHPTHFLRRLRRVALTIPAIAGPYTNVNATLTLIRSETRPTAGAEPLVDLAGGSQAIAISTGQSDAGVFSDSQGDARRMPFEGRGAISHWQLTLPPLQQFDYRTIADCILELHYTARSGATAAATLDLQARLNQRSGLGLGTEGWARSWSVRADFPDAWQAFRQPSGEAPPTLALELSPAHYPFALGPGASRRLRQVHLFAETSTSTGLLGPVGIEGPTATAALEDGAFFPSTLPGTLAASVPLIDDAIGTLTLAFPATLDPSLVRDLIVLVEYDVNLPGAA